MDKPKALVIDPDGWVREGYLRELSALGLDIDTAGTVDDALAKAGPDLSLVVMDLAIAGPIDGAELLSRLRAAAPGVEVVVASGATTVDTALRLFQHGGIYYVAKPMAPSELRRLAARCLFRSGRPVPAAEAPSAPPPQPVPVPAPAVDARLKAERDELLKIKTRLEARVRELENRPPMRGAPAAAPQPAEHVQAMLRVARKSAAENQLHLEKEVAELKAELAGAHAALELARRQSGAEQSEAGELAAELEIWRAKAEAWRLEAASLKSRLVEQQEAFDTRQVALLEELHRQRTELEWSLQALPKGATPPAKKAPPRPAPAPAVVRPPAPARPVDAPPGLGWYYRFRAWWDSI